MPLVSSICRFPWRCTLASTNFRLRRTVSSEVKPWRKNYLVSFNASLENPLATIPVRRYLFDEEVNKQRQEKKEKLINKMSIWLHLGPKPTGGEKSLAMGKSRPQTCLAGWRVWGVRRGGLDQCQDFDNHSPLNKKVIIRRVCFCSFLSVFVYVFNPPFDFQL